MVDYYRKSAIQFRHFCDFVPITKLSFKKSKTKWKMYKYVNTLSWTCSNIINIIVIYEFNDITMLFTFLFHFSLTLCSNHWFSFTGMGLAHLERKFILSMWRIPHIFSLSFWYTQHTHPYTLRAENNGAESISYLRYLYMYYRCVYTIPWYTQHGNKANELSSTFLAHFVIFTFPILV